MSRIDQALAEFQPTSVSQRVLGAIYGTIPYSPSFDHFGSLDDAVRAISAGATEQDVERARVIGEETDEIGDILWMARLMDRGDSGYAVVTGLFSAFKLFRGQGLEAFETDTQQRNDAALKALCLAYLVHKAYPGSVADKAAAFRASDAGKALAIYYAAAEVALPFADNAALAGGKLLGELIDKGGAAASKQLSGMSAGHSLAGATEMLSALTEPISKVVDLTRQYTGPVAEKVAPMLPTLGSGADKIAGLVANAADVLPIYQLLGARLAAESAARRALL